MRTYTRDISIRGNIDLVTQPLRKEAGVAIRGYNYEPRQEGARRFEGFERTDGRPLASAVTYYAQAFGQGSTAIAAGSTVTGATSGATGVAVADAVVYSGDYASNDAVGLVPLRSIVGTFVDGEGLNIGGPAVATAIQTPVENGANNDDDHKAWKIAVEDYQLSVIGAVPGSGDIRGTWHLNGVDYAFRDNTGATACELYRSSPTGWVKVDLGREIRFTAGTGEIFEGDTVTGMTSSASATAERVIVQSGSWSGGDATGRVILSGVSGAFQNAEPVQVSAMTKATASSADTAITLLPGGRFEFVTHNFYGGSGTRRIYGVDGVNRGFEFDGTVFAPVETGIDANSGPADAPTHIAAHKGHLWFSYRGGSLQRSAIGEPLIWEVVLGAGEFAVGSEITGLLGEYAGVMIVATENSMHILYGSDFSMSGDGRLEEVGAGVGAVAGSLQNVVKPIILDKTGIRTLAGVQAFGNFESSLISRYIQPDIEAKKRLGNKIVGSLRVKGKTQYRLFYADGSGYVADFNGSRPEFMPFQYGKPFVALSSVDTGDDEVLLAGDSDGYVYRLDSGTSFDGQPIHYLYRMAFNHFGNNAVNKQFDKVVLQSTVRGTATLFVTADFDYGGEFVPSMPSEEFEVNGGGGFWNEDRWNNFYWSSVEGVAEAYLQGFGTNASVAIAGETRGEEPHTLHGLTFFYKPRGLRR